MNQYVQLLKIDHEEEKGILGHLEQTKESAPKKRQQEPHASDRVSKSLKTMPKREGQWVLEQIIQQGI